MLCEDLQLNLLFFIITIRSEFKKELKIYDVNTGKPIVAVVINAPAKIKKGR